MTDKIRKPRQGRGRPRKDGVPIPAEDLSPGEVLFVKSLSAGKTIAQAYKDACGGGLDPNHSGWQALRTIKLKAPELMDQLGLTQERLIEDHLKPMLAATEVKVFKASGGKVKDAEGNITDVPNEIIYSDPLIAWGPRKEALDISFRLHGSYARPSDFEAQVQVLNKITVVIEDVSREGSHTITAAAAGVQ